MTSAGPAGAPSALDETEKKVSGTHVDDGDDGDDVGRNSNSKVSTLCIPRRRATG